MMFLKERTLLFPIILLIFSAGYIQHLTAQTKPAQTESLIKNSDIIVIGKVSDIRSEWNEEKTRIYTRVTISVDEQLKGENRGKTITLTQLGGEVGQVGELYSHTPKFNSEEEVLIFAKLNRNNNLVVTRGPEGKFNITKDQITGEKKVGSTRPLGEFKAHIKSVLSK